MFGDAAREEVEKRLGGELGHMLRSRLLIVAGWYPVGWYRELLAELQTLDPSPDLSRRVGLTSGRREVKGIYRIMFRMLSTELLVRQAPRFYRMFYKGGHAELLESSSTHALARYSGCAGFDRRVWLDLLGGSEAGFECTGARDLQLRFIEGGRDGDDSALVSVTWT